ncbi:hypothetical protein FRX31_031175, partial [Thalictrum thalictroides]
MQDNSIWGLFSNKHELLPPSSLTHLLQKGRNHDFNLLLILFVLQSNSNFLQSTCEGNAVMGGCVIVLLFWLCEHTNIPRKITGAEERFPRVA